MLRGSGRERGGGKGSMKDVFDTGDSKCKILRNQTEVIEKVKVKDVHKSLPYFKCILVK